MASRRLGTDTSELDAIIAASGKMVLLFKLLPKLRAEGRKVSPKGQPGIDSAETQGLVCCCSACPYACKAGMLHAVQAPVLARGGVTEHALYVRLQHLLWTCMLQQAPTIMLRSAMP